MIVLDTSVIVAAYSSKDANHSRALEILAEVRGRKWGRALVPEWVLVEVLNFALRRLGRAAALRAALDLTASNDSAIIACSPLYARAMQIFTAPRDASLSLADAGVIAVAEEHRTRNIATFDAAFRAFPALNIVEGASA